MLIFYKMKRNSTIMFKDFHEFVFSHTFMNISFFVLTSFSFFFVSFLFVFSLLTKINTNRRKSPIKLVFKSNYYRIKCTWSFFPFYVVDRGKCPFDDRSTSFVTKKSIFDRLLHLNKMLFRRVEEVSVNTILGFP